MSGTEAYVTIDGLRLQYCEHGKPDLPPLICLHGVAMECHSWDRFACALSDRFHVLALTARGHGDSDHAKEYGLAHNLGDTTAFMDTVIGDRSATVCGLSMGGGTAVGLAVLHPQKVNKLIVIEAGPLEPAGNARLQSSLVDAPASWGSYEEALPAFHAGYGDVPDATLLEYMPNVLRRDPDGRLRAKLDPAVIAARTPTPDEGAEATALVQRACAGVKCPALIVRGRNSDLISHQTAQWMADTIPDGRLMEVEAGHVVPLENPEGLLQAITGFL